MTKWVLLMTILAYEPGDDRVLELRIDVESASKCVEAVKYWTATKEREKMIVKFTCEQKRQ